MALSGIIFQIYDFIKEIYVVSFLLYYNNPAWAILFSVPILYGFLGQFAISYHEEKRIPEDDRKSLWKNALRVVFPFYGIIRAFMLLINICKKCLGKGEYKQEKSRLDSRINPVELFNESLPQLLVLNCAVLGLIVNANVDSDKKQIALAKTMRMGLIKHFVVDVIASPFVAMYNSSIQAKEILIENLPLVYDESEIGPLMEKIEVTSFLYEVSFYAAYFGLFMFMIDSPIPLIGFKSIWDGMKSHINNKGYIIGVWLCFYAVVQNVFRVASICFGPIRQINIFSLIFSTYYVMTDGQIYNANFIFWTKLVICLILIVLPCLAVQYYFLYGCKIVFPWNSESIWKKIPFIYGISMFTGVFLSVKELKNYKLVGDTNTIIGRRLCQVSRRAKIVYQIIRICILFAILIVIWAIPSLKVIRIDYFIYMHVIEILDIINLLLFSLGGWGCPPMGCCWWRCSVGLLGTKIMKKYYSPRWREDKLYKWGVYDPNTNHDTTYQIEKIIGKKNNRFNGLWSY